MRKELGLTGTPVQQYLRWLSGFVRGDFGYSIYSGRSVALDIAEKLPVTCALMGLALGLDPAVGHAGGAVRGIQAGKDV